MDKIFETAIFTRKSLLKIMDIRSYEEIVRIPNQFRNSIFWNVAHLLVTPQLITYKRSGLELLIDDELVSKYGKGTVANSKVSQDDFNYVKEHLLEMTLKLKNDYGKGVFSNYEPYMTSTKIELKSIEDALRFSAYHDGIHLGVVLSLLKIV